MNIEIMSFLAGAASVLGGQAVFWLARRILRGTKAASASDALRAAAECRAQKAEDRLRLAELEIARAGGDSIEPEKKINVRQVR